MLSTVTCPNCQYRYSLHEGEMGSRQTCPKCQSDFFAGKSTAEARAGVASASGAQASYAKTMIGEEAAPIKYNCPRCKAPLEAEGIEGGTKKNCPHCTQRHLVPAAAKPAAPAPSPALNRTMLASDESAAPPIKYNCPSCKKPLEAPADQAGTKRNCPACNQRLQIPAAPSGVTNRNKTMLASDESAAPASAPNGTAAANGSRGPAAAPAPANLWAQYATPRNVGIGAAVLVLLALVIPAVIRGGKSVDAEAQARAQVELKKIEADLEIKKMEMVKQEKAEAEARRRYDEEAKERREAERRKQDDYLRALAAAGQDEERKAELKKRQQQEQEQRDKEARERDAHFQQQLAELKLQAEKAKKELEATQQKQQTQQTVIHQPPVIYHPPYHPRYYWPWW